MTTLDALDWEIEEGRGAGHGCTCVGLSACVMSHMRLSMIRTRSVGFDS